MENTSDLEEVGRVSYEALMHAKSIVKEGASQAGVVSELENFIKGKGLQMAFPTNISINSQAAHATPKIGGQRHIHLN